MLDTHATKSHQTLRNFFDLRFILKLRMGTRQMRSQFSAFRTMSQSTVQYYKAIEDSWNADFVDQSPVQGLVEHVGNQLSEHDLYARYCSIVQSSGMGKSRLLDELSKSYFMIPINLREADSMGFPPSDNSVRDFLSEDVNSDSLPRIQSFLVALLEKTTKTIRAMGEEINVATRITKFRHFMAKDQHMGSNGVDRVEFYRHVVDRARKLLSEPASLSDQLIVDELDSLRTALFPDSEPQESFEKHRIYANNSDERFVDVFITFDEAHTLVKTIDKLKYSTESRSVVLRRTLSSLSSRPLFTFFLSTTGSITQFSQPHRADPSDPSNCINSCKLSTPRPYIYLGFDQLMQSCKVFKRWKTLEDVTSLECAAHMGRPLWGSRYDHGNDEVRRTLLNFAEEKLLCQFHNSLSNDQIYAVLSQRLALDTNTTKYYFYSADPVQAVKTMHEQIACHMRVCMAIDDGIETLRGIAPSEPILSEAASRIMLSDRFSLPAALTKVLGGFCINQGDRGEIIVASFFTWARDQVVKDKLNSPLSRIGQLCPYFSVVDLFQHLLTNSMSTAMLDNEPSIRHPDDPPQSFGTIFKNAMMHYNHLIKPQEQKTVALPYLLYFMARGAAALGANCQRGFDAVYPYLYGGTDLDVNKVGFIIVQVKNDSTNHTDEFIRGLFLKMDPFKCQLINDKHQRNGRFPIPIIRIIFLLSGNNNYFKQHTCTPAICTSARFTSYDYVCSGVDKNILNPTREAPDEWKALVNERDDWNSFYNVDVPGVLRSQAPGNATHDQHFTSWLELDA